MTRFLSRRVALAIPILLGVSLVVFFTIKLIPGDPVASLLGPNASPRDRAALVERLGLNQPLPRQYIAWAWAGAIWAGRSPSRRRCCPWWSAP